MNQKKNWNVKRRSGCRDGGFRMGTGRIGRASRMKANKGLKRWRSQRQTGLLFMLLAMICLLLPQALSAVAFADSPGGEAPKGTGAGKTVEVDVWIEGEGTVGGHRTDYEEEVACGSELVLEMQADEGYVIDVVRINGDELDDTDMEKLKGKQSGELRLEDLEEDSDVEVEFAPKGTAADPADDEEDDEEKQESDAESAREDADPDEAEPDGGERDEADADSSGDGPADADSSEDGPEDADDADGEEDGWEDVDADEDAKTDEKADSEERDAAGADSEDGPRGAADADSDEDGWEDADADESAKTDEKADDSGEKTGGSHTDETESVDVVDGTEGDDAGDTDGTEGDGAGLTKRTVVTVKAGGGKDSGAGGKKKNVEGVHAAAVSGKNRAGGEEEKTETGSHAEEAYTYESGVYGSGTDGSPRTGDPFSAWLCLLPLISLGAAGLLFWRSRKKGA